MRKIMNRPSKKKITVYHYFREETPYTRVLKEGLSPKRTFQANRSFVEMVVREHFDKEKPKGVQARQLSSLFFYPSRVLQERDKGFKKLVETKIGVQAVVADAGLFLRALNSPSLEAAMQIARRYWSSAISLEMFDCYYERKEDGSWARKKNAPTTFPRVIDYPEVLYTHKIRPEDLKAVPLGKSTRKGRKK